METDLVNRQIRWESTGDGEYPFQARVDGVRLILRVNDFPAEPLYTLLVDYREAFDLEDWPSAWIRPALTADQLRIAGAAQSARGIVDAIVVADRAHRMCMDPQFAPPDGPQTLTAGTSRAELDELLGPGVEGKESVTYQVRLEKAPFTCEVIMTSGPEPTVRLLRKPA